MDPGSNFADRSAALDRLWDYSQPAASEARFRAMLATERDPEYRAEVFTQVARAQGLQQKFTEALQTLDEVDHSLTPVMTLARARSLLERGRVFNSSGRSDEAIHFFEQALHVASDNDHAYYAIDAAHMLGIACEPDAALAWSKRALDMAEAATEPRARGWRGTLYNNLGWTYHESGDFEQALSMFEASLAIEQKDGQTRLIGIARWSIAKTLRHLDRLDEALAIQTELLDHPDRQNNTSEGYTREELGECLLALDRANEAASHFARAWSLLHADDWLRSQQADRLDRLKRLGKVEAD